MSNPTTPFSWQMPTATDLVTDLPADFEVFGQAVATSMADLLGGTTGQVLSKTTNADMDFTWVAANPGDITAVTAGTGISGGGTSGAVTITNSMATEITAKGDLIAGTGSATFDNLPVGTNGQTLVADSTAATGLKWAAASSGALTFIARTSFSNVASQAFDSVFTSTYKNYLVVFDNIYAATGSDKLQLQFRYSGNTTQTTGLYSNCVWARANAATVTNEYITNGTQANIGFTTGASTTQGSGFMYVSQVGNSSTTAIANGQYFEGQGVYGGSFNALSSTNRTYDGFLLKSSSTNITGTVSIYGLAAA